MNLVGVAEDALTKSVKGFNPALGFKFSSYAVKTIMRNVNRSFNLKRVKTSSLDQEISNEFYLKDGLATDGSTPYEHQENIERVDKIRASLENLSDKERKIMLLIYGFNGRTHTLEEIANVFDCCRENIRQIQQKVLEKLGRNKELVNI